MRKRKTTYTAARAGTRPAPAGPTAGSAGPRPPNLVSIDVTAVVGRRGLSVGDRVLIAGTGLYPGETATVERFERSVIPAAFVRTDDGGTRRVRTIDVQPLGESTP